MGQTRRGVGERELPPHSGNTMMGNTRYEHLAAYDMCHLCASSQYLYIYVYIYMVYMCVCLSLGMQSCLEGQSSRRFICYTQVSIEVSFEVPRPLQAQARCAPGTKNGADSSLLAIRELTFFHCPVV